jgi:hypothetical protein
MERHGTSTTGYAISRATKTRARKSAPPLFEVMLEIKHGAERFFGWNNMLVPQHRSKFLAPIFASMPSHVLWHQIVPVFIGESNARYRTHVL